MADPSTGRFTDTVDTGTDSYCGGARFGFRLEYRLLLLLLLLLLLFN
jgi:hypothetical protein